MTQHFLEHNLLKRLSQPPYSPDISPSDFYRFGKVTNALIGQEIPDESAFLESMTEILGGISGNALRAVFGNWIRRVQGVIDANGGYLSE
jgi:histone-lysine N-methyltransferase SETMAR